MRYRKESCLRSKRWGGEQGGENQGGGERVLGGEADLWVWRKDAGARTTSSRKGTKVCIKINRRPKITALVEEVFINPRTPYLGTELWPDHMAKSCGIISQTVFLPRNQEKVN